MFSSHRWTKERVKQETERVIWSSSGHWGWRRSELEARTFYLDQPYVGCNWASTKFKFNHFSSGAWKLNNGLQYVSQYKYRAFNQLFSSHNCLFPTIDLCNISFLSPMTFSNCADDQMTHHWFSRNTARDGQSFHNHHERTWHPSFHHQPKVHICSPLSHVKALSSITRALTHCHAN